MSNTPGSIVIVLGDRSDRDSDRDWAERQLATVLGSDDARIEHHCDHCGSTDHGRPTVPGGRAFVSLSRAENTVALAISRVGPIGIDIESIAAAAVAPFDDVAFGSDEQTSDDTLRTRLWSAKEAVLKLLVTGLRTDPRDIRLVARDGIRYPERPDLTLETFEAGEGLEGLIATDAPAKRLELRDLRAARGASSNRSSAG